MNSTSLAMNTGGDERCLLQNIEQIRAGSFVCSSLIDVLEIDYYNRIMQADNIIDLIKMETAEPKRKLNFSVGAVYVILIILMIVGISLTNLVVDRWAISRILVQAGVYICLALAAGYVYRVHYISFRYTLTNQMLAIEQIAGNRIKTVATIPLQDISEIGAVKSTEQYAPKIMNASHFAKAESTWITVLEQDKQNVCYRVSISQAFREQLARQWDIAKAQKD